MNFKTSVPSFLVEYLAGDHPSKTKKSNKSQSQSRKSDHSKVSKNQIANRKIENKKEEKLTTKRDQHNFEKLERGVFSHAKPHQNDESKKENTLCVFEDISSKLEKLENRETFSKEISSNIENVSKPTCPSERKSELQAEEEETSNQTQDQSERNSSRPLASPKFLEKSEIKDNLSLQNSKLEKLQFEHCKKSDRNMGKREIRNQINKKEEHNLKKSGIERAFSRVSKIEFKQSDSIKNDRTSQNQMSEEDKNNQQIVDFERQSPGLLKDILLKTRRDFDYVDLYLDETRRILMVTKHFFSEVPSIALDSFQFEIFEDEPLFPQNNRNMNAPNVKIQEEQSQLQNIQNSRPEIMKSEDLQNISDPILLKKSLQFLSPFIKTKKAEHFQNSLKIQNKTTKFEATKQDHSQSNNDMFLIIRSEGTHSLPLQAEFDAIYFQIFKENRPTNDPVLLKLVQFLNTVCGPTENTETDTSPLKSLQWSFNSFSSLSPSLANEGHSEDNLEII